MGEGQSTYGAKDIAEITFPGDQKFTGIMFWDGVGTFKLEGNYDADASRNKVFVRNVPGWKTEFRSLSTANYERENQSRWGGSSWGYGYESRPEANF